VNDELAPGESAHGLGPEQTVRVRDHADKMLSHPGAPLAPVPWGACHAWLGRR
jgi:hypothetical protein